MKVHISEGKNYYLLFIENYFFLGRTKSATFESARNLALGIGIQNFPEGLSVSLPLKAAGFSTWKAIWYGQLSGM